MAHLGNLLIIATLSFWGLTSSAAQGGPNSELDAVGKEVSINASDDLIVSAYWREASSSAYRPSNDAANTTILLFHMAGSSARGEYSEIAPIFNAAGYNTLAVDLRSGGDRLGAPNKTASRVDGADIGYCDAYPDMTAALKWAKANAGDGPIVALGSSFSAGLVIKLGAENQKDIAGVLAFSPASGAPMAACRPESFLEQMTIPVAAFRPDREMAIESVVAQAKAFGELGVPYTEIANGRHGSLMLRESQTGANMDHAWQPVLRFLSDVSGVKAAP